MAAILSITASPSHATSFQGLAALTHASAGVTRFCQASPVDYFGLDNWRNLWGRGWIKGDDGNDNFVEIGIDEATSAHYYSAHDPGASGSRVHRRAAESEAGDCGYVRADARGRRARARNTVHIPRNPLKNTRITIRLLDRRCNADWAPMECLAPSAASQMTNPPTERGS